MTWMESQNCLKLVRAEADQYFIDGLTGLTQTLIRSFGRLAEILLFKLNNVIILNESNLTEFFDKTDSEHY